MSESERSAVLHSRALRALLILVAVTAVLSTIYGIQYFAGSPFQLKVTSQFNDLALSPDGNLVAAAAQDGTVRLWDVEHDWAMRTFSGHRGPVVSVAFDPVGWTLVSASRDGVVRLWDLSTGQVRRELEVGGGRLYGADLSADGKVLATISEDEVVRIWDVASGRVTYALASNGHPRRAVAVSPDGIWVAAADGADIQLWVVHTGQLDRVLVSGWEDETTKEVWLGHRKEVTALVFSPDGRTLASGAADATMAIWDLGVGRVSGMAEGHWAAVTQVAFSPDGNTILSSCRDTNARTWRPSGKYIGTYSGHLGAVNAVSFGPGPDTVLTAGDDGTVRVWETGSNRVLRIIWARPGFLPLWGLVVGVWTLFSGVVGLVCLWGLWKGYGWSHLVTLGLYILGPVVVLGLSLLDMFPPVPPPHVLVNVANILILLLAIVSSLAAVACHIVVIIGLFRKQGRREGLLGIFVPFYSLIRGWMKSTELGVERIILVYAGSFLVQVLLAVCTALKKIPLAYTSRRTVEAAGIYPPLLRLQIGWPLLALLAWYSVLLVVATHGSVAGYYEAPRGRPLSEQLMASRRTLRLRFGLYSLAVWFAVLVLLYSVLRRFNLDVSFMGHYIPFVMRGAGTTLYISAASIALAVVLALIGALGRLSKSPIANGVSGFYISLIRGTPLLVQIFIWYLGLPRLNIVLRAEVAGILALGVNYGAYMTEVFRAGIQAIGKGQHEAAHALGMSGAQTFRRIVLPQAFRIVIPPIGNEFIAMMKDSAMVSVMAIWELTYRAQKIGRQYFRALETFLIAAAFYWFLTVAFQFLQGKLETYMARSERK